MSRPFWITIGAFLLTGTVVCLAMSYVIGRLGVDPAYWLVPIFGGLGGFAGSIRGENKFRLCVLENDASLRMGTLGDVIIGMGGAATLTFLFGGTLKFEPGQHQTYALLASVSLIAGIFGRSMIETAGDRLLQQARQQARETAKEEAMEVVGPSAAIAYTRDASAAIDDVGTPTSYARALGLAEKAIQSDPQYVNAHIEKGRALKRLGRMDEALAALEKALIVRPGEPRVLYNRACYRAVLKKPLGEIIPDLKTAFEQVPKLKLQAGTDKDFDGIRESPEFKEVAG